MKPDPRIFQIPELELIGLGTNWFDGVAHDIEAICGIDTSNPEKLNIYTNLLQRDRNFTVKGSPYKISKAMGPFSSLEGQYTFLLLDDSKDDRQRILPEDTAIFMVIRKGVIKVDSSLERVKLMTYFAEVHRLLCT